MKQEGEVPVEVVEEDLEHPRVLLEHVLYVYDSVNHLWSLPSKL